VTVEGLGHPFQGTAASYDAWYDAHPALYRTELAALKRAVPSRGRGLEIGVGTGRFAAPLGVRYGLDPSPGMLDLARRKGIRTVQGFGEAVPFKAESFGIVLIVFVIEFVDDVEGFLAEAARVLESRGRLVVGFMDKDGAWGKFFHRTSQARRFFHPPSPRRLIAALEAAGLSYEASWQTLFGPPPDLRRVERPRPGFGRGGFVVVRAVKGRPGRREAAEAVDKAGRKT
jgi:ubiquinone/menaquinone biosynthesis C-methylase UbiE